MRALGRSLAAQLAVFAFFLALATLATWPLGSDLGGLMLTRVDPFTDLWSSHWVTTHFFEPASIFGGNIFYPQAGAVLFSHTHMGLMPFLVPLHAFVRDPVTLYNCAMLLALAFSGWAFQLLVWVRTGSRSAGMLVGVLGAFSSHQMYHLLHLPLLVTGWLALFLLGLHLLVERPGASSALLCGVAFGMTALTTGYYGAAAAVIALIFAVVHARLFSRQALAWTAAAVALAALLIWPYARGFMALRADDPKAFESPPELSENMAFTPRRHLNSHAYVFARFLKPGRERMFPGLLGPLLAGVALFRRGRDVALYVACFALLMLLSLGPRSGIYNFLYAIPPLDSMRHPWSFASVALLLLFVLAGIGWSRLSLAKQPWAGWLVVLLAVIETLGPGPRLVRYPRGLPPAYERLRALPRGPILEVPVYAEATMLWAARHGLPVVNGYSAFVPTRTAELRDTMQREWLKQLPADVDATASTRLLREQFGLRYLVLPTGRQKYPLDGADRAGMARLAQALDRSKSFRLLEVVSDGDRIYEVADYPTRASDGKSLEK